MPEDPRRTPRPAADLDGVPALCGEWHVRRPWHPLHDPCPGLGSGGRAA